MANILVRDIPDDIHATLRANAARRHVSLQQYLATELERLAMTRSLDEILDDIESHRGGSVGFTTALADLHEGRSAGR